MAAYSSILAWRIPRTEEPGGLGLQFKGSHRVGRHAKVVILNYIYLYFSYADTHYYKLYFFFHIVYASADI